MTKKKHFTELTGLARIRREYGVPAWRGTAVWVAGVGWGVITSASGDLLKMRMDCGRVVIFHPTYYVRYVPQMIHGGVQSFGFPETADTTVENETRPGG